MISNGYVGLYFYSAVLQANIALLALLGVFVVFKRQEIMTQLQGLESALISFVQNYLDYSQVSGKHIALNYSDVAHLKSVVEEMANDKGGPLNVKTQAMALTSKPEFHSRFQERQAILDKHSKVFPMLKLPFISILVVVLLSLLLLPFAQFIHENFRPFELYIILFVVVANIFALVVTTRFVWRTLQ